MDMKKILQAFDGASSKPVVGSSDMKKFLQVVKEADSKQTVKEPLVEGKTPHKVALPVQMAMQHYSKPTTRTTITEKVSVLGTYMAVVESELQEEAEAKNLRIRMYAQRIAESVNRKNGLLKESDIVPIGQRYDPRLQQGAQPYTIVIDGNTYKFAGRDKEGPGTGEVIKVPAANIGIRGLGAVNVELGQDGFYYSAPAVN